MKKAVVTICIGDEFKSLSELTHPTIRKYAERVGAEFIVIDTCKTTPHWEKFYMYDLLNTYDRIIYLDTDLIVRDDCPDLFEVVPYNQIGAFNEAKFVSREYSLIETAKAYNIDASKINWNGKYYNTGVMVLSKCHKKFFKKPEIENSNFYEQGYLNLKISVEESHRTKEDMPLMFDLSYQFNRMTCLDFCGEVRHASYIIHYAGYHYFTSPGEILGIIQTDLKEWEETGPEYTYRRKIVVIVSGGMGDQVDAEPTLRYLHKIYGDTSDIIITTHWPRLFEHLDYFEVVNHNIFKPAAHRPFYEMKTFPDPTTLTYSVISNLLCHTVDYCSIASLQRVLPLEDKIVRLGVSEEDDKELDRVLNGFDLKKAVVIHPGRHWESKHQPLHSKIKVIGGWKTMGEMKIGDEVCTPDGGTAKVIGVYDKGKKPIYKITFADGRTAESTSEHLWKIYHENWRYDWKRNLSKDPWKIWSLDQIINYSSKRPFSIPLTEPTYGKKTALPIPPYLLGALLGNGSFSENQSIQFSTMNNTLIEKINSLLIEGYSLKEGGHHNYRLTHPNEFKKEQYYMDALDNLGLWGKLSNNKFIPEIYKEASAQDRLELLRGLMDTDGYAGKSGSVAYYTVSEQLANDAQYIVRSLGGMCKINKKTRGQRPLPQGRMSSKESTVYTCLIRHDHPENFFTLSYKMEHARRRDKNIFRKLNIVSIEPVGECDVRCILIDSPEHLYITDDFVVTHNTFPREWWQEVVNTISAEVPVCLIGTDDHINRGAYQLDLPDNSINLIDRTTIGTLISLIARAPVLLSNDSVPVHIAGAFDNWIVVVPTCKHPDHILPFRRCSDGSISNYHKAFALYKKLTLDDCDQRPTTWIEGGATAESKEGEWDEYLPSVEEVCKRILESYKT
jgi:lipopolysaccharide biosynthesis glycosyltransferase